MAIERSASAAPLIASDHRIDTLPTVEATVFYPISRRRVLVMVWLLVPLLAAVMAGLCVVPLVDPDGWFAAVIGLPALAFLVWAWTAWFRLWRRLARGDEPGLRIDGAGFDDSSSVNGAGRVLWEHVEGWSVARIHGQHLLHVALAEDAPDAGPSRARPGRRRRPVQIALNTLRGPRADVVEAFDRAWRADESDAPTPSRAADPVVAAPLHDAPSPARRRPPGRRHLWWWMAGLVVLFVVILGSADAVARNVRIPGGMDPELAFFGVPGLLFVVSVSSLWGRNDAPVARVDLSTTGPVGERRSRRRMRVDEALDLARSLRAEGYDAAARYDRLALVRWVVLQLAGGVLMSVGLFTAFDSGRWPWALVAAAGFGLVVVADLSGRRDR